VAARPAVRLPAGFRSQQVELTVKGLCAGCEPLHGAAHKPQARTRQRR
jgi:hypothetical protein